MTGDGPEDDGGSAGSTDPAGGTYTLLIELAVAATIEVGALGEIDLDAGHYAYTGSALGPGGFARIDRHREIAAGERAIRHWHVDYLLGHPDAAIASVWLTTGADRECAIAGDLPGEPIPDFGASDCGCESHLAFAPETAPATAPNIASDAVPNPSPNAAPDVASDAASDAVSDAASDAAPDAVASNHPLERALTARHERRSASPDDDLRHRYEPGGRTIRHR